MSDNPDQARSITRSDQLIECQVKKAAVEASLHAAQMLLLDTVDILTDETRDAHDRQLGIEHIHGKIRDYLMTSAWVLPPDHKLLASLSLVSADERGDGEGEDPSPRSDGETRA
jgi:hypothetical protein